MRAFVFLSAALALAVAGCGDPKPTEAELAAQEKAADDAAIAAAEGASEAREEVVNSSEELKRAQELLDKLGQDGAIQVGMAKIAAEDAKRDNVKAFAAEAIEFNQQMLSGLRDLTDQADDLELQTMLSDEQQRNFAQLRGALSVDDMFLERTRARYKEMESALSDYAENGELPALKTWATDAKARLDAHRDELAKI